MGAGGPRLLHTPLPTDRARVAPRPPCAVSACMLVWSTAAQARSIQRPASRAHCRRPLLAAAGAPAVRLMPPSLPALLLRVQELGGISHDAE